MIFEIHLKHYTSLYYILENTQKQPEEVILKTVDFGFFFAIRVQGGCNFLLFPAGVFSFFVVFSPLFQENEVI